MTKRCDGGVQSRSGQSGSGKTVQPETVDSDQLGSGGGSYKCLTRGCPSENNPFRGPRNYANHLK